MVSNRLPCKEPSHHIDNATLRQFQLWKHPIIGGSGWPKGQLEDSKFSLRTVSGPTGEKCMSLMLPNPEIHDSKNYELQERFVAYSFSLPQSTGCRFWLLVEPYI
jgi:hypothetical protein